MTEQTPNEFVVWGIAGGDPDPQPLFTVDPKTGGYIRNRLTAQILAQIARNRGATDVRIQEISFKTPPSFT